MSLYDIAGEYQTQALPRPTARGIVASLIAALRRPQEVTGPVEDARAAKHRMREQGYLHDIGI